MAEPKYQKLLQENFDLNDELYMLVEKKEEFLSKIDTEIATKNTKLVKIKLAIKHHSENPANQKESEGSKE